MTTVTPMVTEKAHAGVARGSYTFRVDGDATKPEVARAVAKRFKVTVTGVRINRRPDKLRRRGRITGVRRGFKKAVVQLKEGDKIAELEG